jgi:hypothetical protein
MAQECLTAIAFKNCARRIAGLIEYVGAAWILTRLRDFESVTKFFQTGLNYGNLDWRAAACRFFDRLNRRRAEACLVAGLKQLLLGELLGESHGSNHIRLRMWEPLSERRLILSRLEDRR